MKKLFVTYLFILIFTSLTGCVQKNSVPVGNNTLSSDVPAETPATNIFSPSDAPSQTLLPDDATPSSTPEESYTEIVDENGIVSDMCDIDSDYNFLQFNNCDELYAKLPMYAFNILRDSTSSYLMQCGLEDATTFTYLDDSLDITEDHVCFICSIEEYPEYNLAFDYSINDACYNYALVIK